MIAKTDRIEVAQFFEASGHLALLFVQTRNIRGARNLSEEEIRSDNGVTREKNALENRIKIVGRFMAWEDDVRRINPV